MREKILTYFKNIIESKFSMLFLSFVSILSFTLDLPFISYFVLLLTVLLILISDAEAKPLAGLIMLFTFSYREKGIRTDFGLGFLIGLGIVVGIVALIYLFKKRVRIVEIIKTDLVFDSLLFILLVMLISIRASEDIKLSFRGLYFYFLCVATYFLAKLFIKPSSKEYVTYSFVVSGITLSIMALIGFLFKLDNLPIKELIKFKTSIKVGYSNPNHIAAILNVVLIFAIYYFITYKSKLSKILMLIYIPLFVICTLIARCRGGYLSLAITMPFVIAVVIYHYLKDNGKNIKNDLLYIGIVLGEVAIIFITFASFGYLKDIINQLIKSGVDLSGRDKIYRKAFRIFLDSPLIGKGCYSSHYYLKEIGFGAWNYHNHILQFLATGGILGMISFVIFLYASIKVLISKDIFKLMLLCVTLYFLVHGIFDTIYFNKIVMPLLFIPLALVEPKEKYYELNYNI